MVRFDPDIHHRRSIRLRDYDYAQVGLYFVTLCIQDRERLFDDVVDDEPLLNDTGLIVAECWRWLADRYDHVELDDWVVMPNHLHGIVNITDDSSEMRDEVVGSPGGSRTAPTNDAASRRAATRKPLGRLVGAFKTVSTNRINALRDTPGATVWQRDFYEHVIRDERDLDRIRRYIANNPSNWPRDAENPSRLRSPPS